MNRSIALAVAIALPSLAWARLPTPQVRLDFETYPNGSAACARCPLTDEFRARGVVFSFRSRHTQLRHAQLVESTAYDPPERGPNHSVTAALSEEGFHVGVLELSFVSPVSRVAFVLRGSDVIAAFAVRAYDEAGRRLPASAVTRSGRSRYTSSGGGGFRQETVAIGAAGPAEPGEQAEAPRRIARVELDGTGPPGHILLVDDLEWRP